MTDYDMIRFFIPMDEIPRTTAQMKGCKVVRGKPYFYTKPEIKKIANLYAVYLKAHKPLKPLEGAIKLTILFCFPAKKPHKHGQPKVTRPDTDNMAKLIKDVMTDCGFWVDDAQVFDERYCKVYSDNPGVAFIVEEYNPKVVFNILGGNKPIQNTSPIIKLKCDRCGAFKDIRRDVFRALGSTMTHDNCGGYFMEVTNGN